MGESFSRGGPFRKMNSISTPEAFIKDLLRSVPDLTIAYEEHATDNDALLPHVFLGDVTRWAIAATKNRNSLSSLTQLLDHMETGLTSGSEAVKELIAVSFLENLCGEKAALRSLKPLMGPSLKKEVENVCGE